MIFASTRLRTLHTTAYSNTGVPGISFIHRASHKGGPLHRFYYVRCGTGRTHKLNIDTIGKQEAWRRAVALRADYERAIEEANAAILAARKSN
jgi:hypothetical protein